PRSGVAVLKFGKQQHLIRDGGKDIGESQDIMAERPKGRLHVWPLGTWGARKHIDVSGIAENRDRQRSNDREQGIRTSRHAQRVADYYRVPARRGRRNGCQLQHEISAAWT